MKKENFFYGATSLEMYCLLFFFWAVWSSSWYWSRLDKVKSLVQLLGWKNKECVQFADFSVCFLFPWISCSFWSSFHCSLSLLSFFVETSGEWEMWEHRDNCDWKKVGQEASEGYGSNLFSTAAWHCILSQVPQPAFWKSGNQLSTEMIFVTGSSTFQNEINTDTQRTIQRSSSWAINYTGGVCVKTNPNVKFSWIHAKIIQACGLS